MFNKTLRMLFLPMIVLTVITIFLSGCRDSGSPIDQVLRPPIFSVVLEINADQETHGSLLVTNPGESAFPADEDFKAEANLWDQNGAPRFKIEAPIIREIKPGESVYLSSGYWHLDPGVYFLTWGSPKYGGSITIFSVVEASGRLVLGESQSFRTKPVSDTITATRAGRVEAFSLAQEGTLVVRGETSLPDRDCLFPLLFDQDGLLEGFPSGQCAPISEGRWQLRVPADPEGAHINIQPDTSYRVILFANDLTIAPSEPFEILISPPPAEK